MTSQPNGEEAGTAQKDHELRKKSAWEVARYPLGTTLIALYFYVSTQPPAIGYSNAAQQGGSSITKIAVFWLLFYVFISRKNGPVLNLIAPVFAVGAALLAFNLSKGCWSGPPCYN